jgi:hypothetical protein
MVTSCDTGSQVNTSHPSHVLIQPCLRTSPWHTRRFPNSIRSSTPTQSIIHPPIPSLLPSLTTSSPSSPLSSHTGSPPASSTSSTLPTGHGSTATAYMTRLRSHPATAPRASKSSSRSSSNSSSRPSSVSYGSLKLPSTQTMPPPCAVLPTISCPPLAFLTRLRRSSLTYFIGG